MTLDPEQARAILASFLTLAGGTVVATIVAQVVQAFKRIPRFGTWLDAGREYVASLGIGGGLLIYAAIATGYTIDLVSAFALFLAWLGFGAIVGAAHDQTPAGINAALSGKPSGT